MTKMIRPVLATIVMMGLAACLRLQFAAAQPSTPAFIHVSTAAVNVKKNVSGGVATATVTVTIDKGYHIQGNNAKDPYIPTTATVTSPAGITIGKIVYPAAVKKEFSGEKIPVYENKVAIKIPLTIAMSVKNGAVSIPVTIEYQGCNTKSCFPPAKISTNISVTVGEAK